MLCISRIRKTYVQAGGGGGGRQRWFKVDGGIGQGNKHNASVRIRTGSEKSCQWILDSHPVSESGFISRRAKMTHKNRKKLRNFMSSKPWIKIGSGSIFSLKYWIWNQRIGIRNTAYCHTGKRKGGWGVNERVNFLRS